MSVRIPSIEVNVPANSIDVFKVLGWLIKEQLLFFVVRPFSLVAFDIFDLIFFIRSFVMSISVSFLLPLMLPSSYACALLEFTILILDQPLPNVLLAFSSSLPCFCHFNILFPIVLV